MTEVLAVILVLVLYVGVQALMYWSVMDATKNMRGKGRRRD